MSAEPAELESRILILAPYGRDAALTEEVLRGAGFPCRVCENAETLFREAAEGCAALLIAEEALSDRVQDSLDALLRNQPEWSDLPLLLLTRPGAGSGTVLWALERLSNVTVIERPARVATLVSAVRVATRSRQRQYEVRGRMEAQALLSAIVTSSDDAILSKDLQGTITAWNAGAERLFGYAAEEAIGRPISMLIPADRLEEERAILEGIRSGRGFDDHDSVRLRKDGSRVHVSLTISPIVDARGRIIGASKIARDVTERRRAEVALRESEERFRSLVTVVTDVPWAANARGELVPPQPAWADYTGQTDDELRGFGWLDAIHPEDRARVRETWERAREMRSLFETDGRLWHARGREYRYFLARATPIFQADGSLREWVGACTDIHERHRAEQALKEADRRKNEFLATLAHELRNPLAPIRNVLGLMSIAGRANPQLDYVSDVLERQVSHMVRLVDDLTEVSRITLGKIELQRECLELSSVVHSAIETCQPLLDAGRHRLEVDLSPEPLVVDGDRVRLAQVFSNLLNNAAKYSEDGGGIRLAVRRDGESVVVSVRDSGIGIATEMLPRVFDMFTQLDSSPRRRYGGLGIGLTLVQNLVHMHGGTVAASSEGPGRGSEFIVRLPLARGPVPAAPAPPRDLDLPPLRVLVVDDNRDAAESSGMLLKVLGAEPCVVNSGPAALDALESFDPDLVLLDLGMPGMDGFEVARRIRSDPAHRDLTLVALTGWGQEEDRQRSKLAGFDHHLVKPTAVDSLRDLMVGARSPRHSTGSNGSARNGSRR